MHTDIVFTVFTPAYNRAHTLHRVYSSLQKQTYRQFEWLVVDDGSIDDTESVVQAWVQEQAALGADGFPVRYIKKANGGKHTATNRGVAEAQGRFFLTLDSDDECVPAALERLLYHWNTIPEDARARFSAVTALCMQPDGTVEGSRFPSSPFDSDSIESHTKYGVTGEKWGFQRTDVMRAFPFPEFPGERFIPEGLVWNRIAGQYKTRYVNEALRIYHPEEESLSASMLLIRVKSPRGTSLYYNELASAPVGIKSVLKAVINYCRFSFHGGMAAGAIIQAARRRLAAALLLPAAYLLYKYDKRSLNAAG